MIFEEWFERWRGKRPTSISLASLRRQMVDAREHAKEAEEKWREADQWEREQDAARTAWHAAKEKGR
jgi:hypothetical protein